MRITRAAQAGSERKGDALVGVSPKPGGGLSVELAAKAITKKQFGAHIEAVAREAAGLEGVDSALIEIRDAGALDFTLRARVRAAVRRAARPEGEA
ncbi:MAG: citrate lyase acyl carrier protein [Clostridiales Family XIII bacterium]|jgi:citrate lyase subunit gamma (acyl carrier protein)|nr:citrate lyase acyl carrier protein [Clostridiales Family XIII bacterium]